MKQRQPALYGVYEMLKAEEKDLVLKGIHSKKGLFHISWNSSIIEELGQMLQHLQHKSKLYNIFHFLSIRGSDALGLD